MIAAGGTGGHVYPALAVAEALLRRKAGVSLFFVGAAGGFERPMVEQAALPWAAYDEVWGGPVVGVNPLRAAVSALKLVVGAAQAIALMRRHRPQALLLTGGWAGLPAALAAWLLGVPALIYLPDVEPGSTVKFLQRFVRRVAVTTAESAAYFPVGKTVTTGYPLRAALLDAAARPEARQQAMAHFGLDPARQTLLVFGGSRGARSINNALMAILPALLDLGLQVIHVTGALDWERVQAEKSKMTDLRHYHAYPYLHADMALAFAAADLVICRAGASVLGELPLFGVPSILAPYPYAWRYQKVNADYLAERGAAIRMADEALADELLPTVRGLLSDPARLAQMRACAAALAQPDGAWRVGQELIRLAGGTA